MYVHIQNRLHQGIPGRFPFCRALLGRLSGRTNGLTPDWPFLTGDPEATTFQCSAPLISTSSFNTPRCPLKDVGLRPIGESVAICARATTNVTSQSPVDFPIMRMWERFHGDAPDDALLRNAQRWLQDGYGEDNSEQRTFILWLT
ncbi:hypothetical protein DL771_001757 [Monosporascus sp. 5C6A]|nr:hypothetical protein DL771_001757 [Monosporascus sp. 5C6A]